MLRILLLCAVCLSCFGFMSCNSPEKNEKPDWLSPKPQQQTNINEDDEKDRKKRIAERIDQQEKILGREEKLAHAQLDLSFARRRLALAQERIQRLKGGEDELGLISASRWKLSAAKREVEKAEDRVAKAERKLRDAKGQYINTGLPQPTGTPGNTGGANERLK